MAWDNLARTYAIRDARIVVLIDDGGAAVEKGDFEFDEGRYLISYGGDPDRPPQLEWGASFRTLGAGAPDKAVMIEGRIVIDGTCDDGRIEIRGNGWFGYDEKGQVDGRFEPDIPVILLDSAPEKARDPDEPPYDPTAWSAYMDTIEPQTSAEYERAARGRSLGDY
jgi:hypothetical protein